MFRGRYQILCFILIAILGGICSLGISRDWIFGVSPPKDSRIPSGVSSWPNSTNIDSFYGSLSDSVKSNRTTVFEGIASAERSPAFLVDGRGTPFLILKAMEHPVGNLIQLVTGNSAPQLIQNYTFDMSAFEYAIRGDAARRMRTKVGESVVEVDCVWQNLGVVPEGSRQTATFRISNVGNSCVKLGVPSAECGCTGIEIQGETSLVPGSTASVLANIQVRSAALKTRMFLPVTDEKSEAKRVLTLVAFGNSVIEQEVYPGKIDFGEQSRLAITKRHFEIIQPKTKTSKYTRVRSEGIPIDGVVTLKKDEEFRRVWGIDLTLNCKELAIGSHRGKLYVDSGNPETPSAVLGLHLTIPPPVEFAPSTIALGVLPLGSIATESIAFRSTNASEIQNVRFSENCLEKLGADLEICSSEGGRINAAIRLPGKKLGVNSGEINCIVETQEEDFRIEIPYSFLVVE